MFKPGDVVTLTAGGARFTVTAVDGIDVEVFWLSDGGNPQREWFPSAVLVLAEPPQLQDVA